MLCADGTSRQPTATGAGATPGAALAAVASDAARLLLELDPVLADHATQVAVDGFVEQAARALDALASLTAPGT